MLKLIPFNDKWLTLDRMDVHAIYRRPRYKEDQFGEMHRELNDRGLPTWDLTGPLPVKQHNKWRAKGFEYVTLANRDSLVLAARAGTLPEGTRFHDWVQDTTTNGPWNYKKYIVGQEQTTTLEAEQLEADVREFGSAAVETIRRRHDQTFRLPDHLRDIAPRTEPVVVALPDDGQKKGGKRNEAVGA